MKSATVQKPVVGMCVSVICNSESFVEIFVRVFIIISGHKNKPRSFHLRFVHHSDHYPISRDHLPHVTSVFTSRDLSVVIT